MREIKQIRIFDDKRLGILQEKVNNFIKKHPDYEINKIKFSHYRELVNPYESQNVYQNIFTAIIIYTKEIVRYEKLEYHYAETFGLWATDRPDVIPENIKIKYFFQIKKQRKKNEQI